jgi:hypothetical protein
MATRDAIHRQHQTASQPHRVVRRTTQPWYDDRGEPRAWCTKPDCRWTWDGVGSYDFAKTRHEQLNDPAATTNPEEEQPWT